MTAETLENLAIALTKLPEATLKINSSAAIQNSTSPSSVPILHPSGTDSSYIHSNISNYDSDTSSETEVFYARKDLLDACPKSMSLTLPLLPPSYPKRRKHMLRPIQHLELALSAG